MQNGILGISGTVIIREKQYKLFSFVSLLIIGQVKLLIAIQMDIIKSEALPFQTTQILLITQNIYAFEGFYCMKP